MLRIERLRTADDPIFAPAMALYAASFPEHEQRLDPSQCRIMAHEQYHFGLLCDGERFVGLALYWDAGAYFYVEHLCIVPERRLTFLWKRASLLSSKSTHRWMKYPAAVRHSTSARALPPTRTRTFTRHTVLKTRATPSWSCLAPARSRMGNMPPSPHIFPMLS